MQQQNSTTISSTGVDLSETSSIISSSNTATTAAVQEREQTDTSSQFAPTLQGEEKSFLGETLIPAEELVKGLPTIADLDYYGSPVRQLESDQSDPLILSEKQLSELEDFLIVSELFASNDDFLFQDPQELQDAQNTSAANAVLATIQKYLNLREKLEDQANLSPGSSYGSEKIAKIIGPNAAGLTKQLDNILGGKDILPPPNSPGANNLLHANTEYFFLLQNLPGRDQLRILLEFIALLLVQYTMVFEKKETHASKTHLTAEQENASEEEQIFGISATEPMGVSEGSDTTALLGLVALGVEPVVGFSSLASSGATVAGTGSTSGSTSSQTNSNIQKSTTAFSPITSSQQKTTQTISGNATVSAHQTTSSNLPSPTAEVGTSSSSSSAVAPVASSASTKSLTTSIPPQETAFPPITAPTSSPLVEKTPDSTIPNSHRDLQHLEQLTQDALSFLDLLKTKAETQSAEKASQKAGNKSNLTKQHPLTDVELTRFGNAEEAFSYLPSLQQQLRSLLKQSERLAEEGVVPSQTGEHLPTPTIGSMTSSQAVASNTIAGTNRVPSKVSITQTEERFYQDKKMLEHAKTPNNRAISSNTALLQEVGFSPVNKSQVINLSSASQQLQSIFGEAETTLREMLRDKIKIPVRA